MKNNRFREAREERNLTQEYVANQLSVTRQAYGRYESGERECSFDNLRKLSRLFDTTIDYLLCNEFPQQAHSF
ncbi:MAG: helix-turn-helix transcriptional regulator [Selenomonadaceae bacterium]|nr:helix-turn-helix transcriptional regulator [Selenomonadaceae bacterium]